MNNETEVIREIAPVENLPERLRDSYRRVIGEHHLDVPLLLRAATEIERLRELIRRALADGMGVLDEPDYDLYAELATYLGPSEMRVSE